MKKSILAALALVCSAAASAQVTAYVCEGYDEEAIEVNSKTDITISDDRSTITVGKKSFDLADVDSITFMPPQFPSVDIVWNGTDATVSVPATVTGVTYTVNAGHVSITSTNTTDELLYTLSGTSDNGSLTLNGSYKLRMHLNGVTLTNPKGAAIDIECGKRIEVKLIKGTVNTLADGANGTQKAAFYTKGHLELKGKGTLNVTGNTKHAICAAEYLQLKSSTGDINILGAASDGIHCGKGKKGETEHNRFIMNGGNLTIANCGSDCIDADDFGSMYINDGSLHMNIAQKDGTGLKCDSVIYMTGGNIDFSVTGDLSQAIRFNYNAYFSGGNIEGTVSGNGAKGFKAKKVTASTAVNNGGDVHFDGTDVTLTVSGGTYTADNTKCAGIHIDRDFYQTAGDIHVTKANTAALTLEVKGTKYITGGTYTEQ